MTPARKRRGRRGGGRRGTTAQPRHSSQPTSRLAYAETRQWLLDSHGPICAYCGVTYSPRSLTLDHVTPRKGQSAYDRRDNLVLACKRCNAAKADKPFLVFLLAQRPRAERLLRYGDHLSDGIKDILRHLVGEDLTPAAPAPSGRIVYGRDPHEESPYRDAEPSAHRREKRPARKR
jgi:5-methylcytosine-specific restriction endonuclease McrA